MQELAGKVAVITGAGSGIGAAVARACADVGMSVAVVDVDATRAEEVAHEMATAGLTCAPFVVDVSDAAGVERLASDVFERFGGAHLLHNNAGICPMGAAWQHDDAEWRQVLDVNLLGVVHGVNAFVPRMLAQGEPAHIVNTASAAALRYVPSSGLYNATKFAVVGFSESLRAELVPHGIGVSVLCPGGVMTNIGETTRTQLGSRRSDDDASSLMAAFSTVDAAHITPIDPARVAAEVLEGVRRDDPYIITHPGSAQAVRDRHHLIEVAYEAQRARHPDLP